ncbi:pleckstrin homology domain-containing family B member 1-like isoform X2 [Megalops cyprinoides]|uniref:pleckstrin homology domain-containing family B member 1-like isoform X2 n=1 Tax=Megalops cyprinoides TaxID=118141 RepID=UPI001864C993|nr:pleckstrin homology domain-containing family B member 1-like isoform X2 [Megalops cyprinoides]
MALIKSGWLWRQSSILKRWKLNFFDLWVDGNFICYKDESRNDHESTLRLKERCINVKSGLECAGFCPPEGRPRECLLVAFLRDGSNLVMCANSEDEALSWKLALMEAKRSPVYTYDPYDDNYQFVPIDSHNAVYISPDTHHIVIREDPCDGIGEQVALGLLAGMATGAALRSLLWMPFWFC